VKESCGATLPLGGFPVAPEDDAAFTPGLTAHRAVNAVPLVCKAAPGLRSTFERAYVVPWLQRATRLTAGASGATLRGMGAGRVPGPLGAGGTAVVTPEVTESSSPMTLDAFKRAVKQQQIEHLLLKGRHFIAALPAAELEVVDAPFKLHKTAAGKCRELLAAAREALEAAKQEGDEGASQTENIVIHSAYRDFNEDGRAWEGAFRKQYHKMQKKKLFAHDPLGPAALRYIVKKMIPLKAPPGYSNHSNGLAVDFGTTVGGVYFGANSDLKEEWKQIWLYQWLKKHAKQFKFKQLPSEEWHWDFVG
jgi:LAS superfamily LD-carboxypeptidase LdcB